MFRSENCQTAHHVMVADYSYAESFHCCFGVVTFAAMSFGIIIRYVLFAFSSSSSSSSFCTLPSPSPRLPLLLFVFQLKKKANLRKIYNTAKLVRYHWTEAVVGQIKITRRSDIKQHVTNFSLRGAGAPTIDSTIQPNTTILC